MSQPIEIVAPPIFTHGAEDAYDGFDLVYSEEILAGLSDLALSAARDVAPDIQDDDILASGFSGGYSAEDLSTADAVKLERRSSVKGVSMTRDVAADGWIGFEGDDSSEINIAEREIHLLREEKRRISRDLGALFQQGILTPGEQASARAELASLDGQIKAIREAAQAAGNLPVYYATPVRGLLDRLPEYNPLSYVGGIPGTGHLALYDGRRIAADSQLRVTEKAPGQVRIAGHGLQIMRHALAVVRLEFTQE